MRLLYSTVSSLQVELTERFSGSVFKLYFADEFNCVNNPASSNPFRIFVEYQDIFVSNDRLNPKYIKHLNGLKKGTKRRMQGSPDYSQARALIKNAGMHGIRPVLAILEGDTYVAHGKQIQRLPPNCSGSPTSIEYLLQDIHGPKAPDSELHLHHLY